MIASQTKFDELKALAKQNSFDIPLTDFGNVFSEITDFFPNLTFKVGDITLLSETPTSFRFTASSKDFLFKRTLLDDSVKIDARIEFINDKLEIVAICTINKAID